MLKIINTKIAQLEAVYTPLRDKLREQAYLTDSDTNTLCKLSYQLKILKEVLIEHKPN